MYIFFENVIFCNSTIYLIIRQPINRLYGSSTVWVGDSKDSKEWHDQQVIMWQCDQSCLLWRDDHLKNSPPYL